MNHNPKVSVIIPFKGENEHIHEALKYLSAVDYPEMEVILLPDAAFDMPPTACQVMIVPTGSVGPGHKRDLALPHASGEILAFLDDDTYPEPDWLKNAVRYFEDPKVAAVGGPAVTPPGDTPRQRASGHVYTSLLGGGPYAYRYWPQAQRAVDDYPTCNLLVRRSVFEQIGGFDTTFWPGEDTKLCLDIIHLGLKILYVPDVVVYHHRRELFSGHLKQVRQYAMHRGYFVKRFPETSLRPSYFLPTALVLGGFLGGLLAIFWKPFRKWFGLGAGVYAGVAVVSAAQATKKSNDLRQTPLVTAGIMVTHLIYGIWFIKGLFANKLEEE